MWEQFLLLEVVILSSVFPITINFVREKTNKGVNKALASIICWLKTPTKAPNKVVGENTNNGHRVSRDVIDISCG